jgi:hypothetical protein
LREFVGVHNASLRGGELKGGPVRIGFGVFEVFVEVIATFGSTDEERAAVTVTERGTENFGPGLGTHGGELIEDDEIETVTTERVGTVGATDGQG